MANYLTHPVIRDVLARLERVGLGYLSLGQSLDTLSGGERQRLKLAKELAQPVELYLIDEPTTGLHGSDTRQLLGLIDHLIDDLDCTVVVIEHNLDVIAQADYVIDLGPGAGTRGGSILFSGTPHELAQSNSGPTAKALHRYLAQPSADWPGTLQPTTPAQTPTR